MSTIIPVILSGGSGTRLWPLSRAQRPKQFLQIFEDKSLLQQTISRAKSVCDSHEIIIVANNEHRFVVAEQCAEEAVVNPAILLEPVGRNTAPAIAVAAFEAIEKDPDAILFVMPSDHYIPDNETLRQSLLLAIDSASQDFLVTFGISPNSPSSAYGYIQAKGSDVADIAQFIEKPDTAKAQQLIVSGDCYWNSGMFVFKASQYLSELEKHNNAMYEVVRQLSEQKTTDMDFIRFSEELFASCPEDSIDYAVMEKTDHAKVVPLDVEWSDLGAWDALYDVGKKDAQGNVIQGDVLLSNVNNSYVRSKDRLVSLVDVDNLIVVDTPDAILVANKQSSQDVKHIVNQLKKESRVEATEHREVYRPWGKYDSIANGDRFQVKRITVWPGARLSLQMHHHRAEHWIIVAGTAIVERDEEEVTLTENQSIYIPLGAKHRLTNKGKIPLELIEVQSGSYLGEDDIVRFDDIYGRNEEKK